MKILLISLISFLISFSTFSKEVVVEMLNPTAHEDGIRGPSRPALAQVWI